VVVWGSRVVRLKICNRPDQTAGVSSIAEILQGKKSSSAPKSGEELELIGARDIHECREHGRVLAREFVAIVVGVEHLEVADASCLGGRTRRQDDQRGVRQVRFIRKKQALGWVVRGYDDGWFVEAWDPLGDRHFPATFGPYETKEGAEFWAVMYRAVLPTRRSLRLLKRPAAYEHRLRTIGGRMVALMSPEQRERGHALRQGPRARGRGEVARPGRRPAWCKGT
jgi:hypothetical protein